MSDATAYRHGVLCDFCFNLFRQVTCNFCRNLVNPPEEVNHNTRPGLFSCPEYNPAKPYLWNRRGFNGHYTIKAVHFNSEQHTTPWQPPFSWNSKWENSVQWPPLEGWCNYKRVPGTREPAAPVFCVIDWPLFPRLSCIKQSELPNKTVVPGRIVIILDISEELTIFPDTITYPVKRNPNAKESKGWIMPGKTEDYKLKASLAPDTRLYAAPVNNVPTKRGGGPIERTGVYRPPGPGLFPKEDYIYLEEGLKCDPYIYYKVAWYEKNKGKDDDMEKFSNTRETLGDDYEEPNWSRGDYGPSGEDFDFGRAIPGLEGTFYGEGYLIQGEEGSPAISVDKDTTVHYCTITHLIKTKDPADEDTINIWRKYPNRFYLMVLPNKLDKEVQRRRSNISRTVWYHEPKKATDKRWYCLNCVKSAGVVDVGRGRKKWEYDDIELIKVIGKIGRKNDKPDYKLEIHYWAREQRLDNIIRKYLREQAKREQFNINGDLKSFFHYELVRDDGYLRTAILTATVAINDTPYTRKAKGGRPPGNGANSIARWCRINFASQVTYDDEKLVSKYRLDPNSHRGVIDVVFNVNSIRKILGKTKTISYKPPHN